MGVEYNISNEWSESTLGDLITHKKGFAFKSKDYSKHGRKIVKVKDFTSNSIDDTECDLISEELAESFSEYELKHKDVVIQTVGSWPSNPASIVGKVIRVPQKVEGALLNQNAVKLNCTKNVDNDFLFYSLIFKRFKSHLISRAQGSANQASITLNDIFDYELNLPPLPEQKAIAKVLTAFDDKIELLQAQNKTLETMAQTIFKEWFGKYQVGDELPEGWIKYSLSELVETINGYSYKGKELVEKSNEALVTLKSFNRNGGFQTRGFKPFLGNPKPEQEVRIGDLVVAHTDLTQDAEVLGNPAFIFDNGGFEKMYITMDLVKVISKHREVGLSFLYYLMKDRYFKGHCIGYSNGTTVLHLSKKAIPEYELYLPTDFDLIERFTKIADDTTNKISLNIEEIKTLTKTRDTLLPKLMSGQVRVKNLKQTADA